MLQILDYRAIFCSFNKNVFIPKNIMSLHLKRTFIAFCILAVFHLAKRTLTIIKPKFNTLTIHKWYNFTDSTIKHYTEYGYPFSKKLASLRIQSFQINIGYTPLYLRSLHIQISKSEGLVDKFYAYYDIIYNYVTLNSK